MPTANSIGIESRDFILMTTFFPNEIYTGLSKELNEYFLYISSKATITSAFFSSAGCKVSIRISDLIAKNFYAFLENFSKEIGIYSRDFVLRTTLPPGKIYKKFEETFQRDFAYSYPEASIPKVFSGLEGYKVSVQIPDWSIRNYRIFLAEFADKMGLKFQDPWD